MIVLPVGLLGLVLAAFALAPHGIESHLSASAVSEQLLPPSAIGPPRPRPRRGPGSPALPVRDRQLSGHVDGRRRWEGWASGGPERGRGQRDARDRPQVPDAYLLYETGRLPHWVRDAIVKTSLPAHPPLPAHPVRLANLYYTCRRHDVQAYRVLCVTFTGRQTAGISYVAQQGRAETGAFLVRLAKAGRRWVVARAEL